nr:maleylpyruvate isomerase family mycothiol-dependent enzyme [Micromonospora sp. DSM 115978]
MPQRLTERAGCGDDPGAVVEAFATQRRRFIGYLTGLAEPDWQRPSRCAGWSVHDVTRHVRDGLQAHTAGLAGRPSPFGGGRFDPTRTPAQWLARTAGESPADTLRDLAAFAAEETDLLAARLARADTGLARGPFGREAHWSTRSLHVLWDAWLHERDVLVPLGVEAMPVGPDLQLAILYGLLAAATPMTWTGRYLRTTVILDGSPSGGYAIGHEGDEIVIAAAPDAASPLRAETGTLMDSIAGRGPAPAAVLRAATPATEQLGLLRKAFAADR